MEKPVSVMLADSSESFRKLLGELIDAEEDMFVAACAEDGAEAARLAEELKPDVLITELLLREIEGLAVLKRLKDRSAMPYTIVVTGFFNDNVAELASELGVARFFPKPCRISALIESVRASRIEDREEAVMKPGVLRGEKDRRIDDALLQCGFNPYALGWGYTKAALLAAEADESRLEGVTKDLYPELARRFGTSSGNVERCIRSAIDRAWREGDPAAREEWFGSDIAPVLGKRPGNVKFLKLMLDRLKKSQV